MGELNKVRSIDRKKQFDAKKEIGLQVFGRAMIYWYLFFFIPRYEYPVD